MVSNPRQQLRWAVTAESVLELHPDVLGRLPKTALEAMHDAGTAAVMNLSVTARCVVAERIDEDLNLYAYLVDPAHPPRRCLSR